MLTYQNIQDIVDGVLKIDALQDNNITATLTIEVPLNDFSKIDEDLFYRQSQGDAEFIPSDDVITIECNGIHIHIKKKP